jgi:hypothetical protein
VRERPNLSYVHKSTAKNIERANTICQKNSAIANRTTAKKLYRYVTSREKGEHKLTKKFRTFD